MIDLLKNIFLKKTTKPSGKVEESFKSLFPNAINVEWSNGRDVEEAIFYLNQIEYIARYKKNGTLIDYRINMAISDIPDYIRNVVLQHGEIMNCISINKSSGIESYEIIFRDDKLIRYTLSITPDGTETQIKEL